MHKAPRHFWSSESGAVTVEFVILLPLILAIFILIGSTSALFVTATELQEISFSMARMSVRYDEPGRDVTAVCADLIHNQSATAYQLGHYIDPNQIRALTCSGDPASRVVTVSIAYDLTGHFGAVFGRLIGMDVESLTRTARLQL